MNTWELQKSRLRFIKKHYELITLCIEIGDDHKNMFAQQLIDKARMEVPYSPSTWAYDIYKTLVKDYETSKM